MRIPIPFAGSYNERTIAAISKQTAINMYPEIDGSRLIMRQRYGLKLNQIIGIGPFRGMLEANGIMYFVSNNSLYEFNTVEVATEIGTLNTFSGRVEISDNGIDLMIVDGSDGYAFEYSTRIFTRITDADFTVLLATKVKFLDGYFIVNRPGTGEFYISTKYPSHVQLTTGGSGWNPLDFSNAEADTDDISSIETDKQLLVLFGLYTTEIFFNSGNEIFPFERQPGGVFEWGCLAPFSVAKGDNVVVWLARNRSGQGQVVKATGQSPLIISTSAVEERISSLGTVTDAYAFIYKEGFHTFYVLIFKVSGVCLVFDFTTNLWHERKSYDADGWRVSSHCFFNGKHYVGDSINGNLYTLDQDTFTDNSTTIRRTIATNHSSENQDKLFCHEIEIICEPGPGLLTGQGSDPKIMLRWSDDLGHTYSDERLVPIGKIGEYRNRARTVNCGSYRNRTWEASVTDPIRWTVVGAVGRFSKGSD